jgi:hypothetical protein
MRCAYCPTCNSYPEKLFSWPYVDEQHGEPVKADMPIVLNNDGTSTDQWADGTVGVTEEAKEMVASDEPVCGECQSDVVWREVEGGLFPVRYGLHDGVATGITLRYCSTTCRDKDPLDGEDGLQELADIPEEWCCDYCSKPIVTRQSIFVDAEKEHKEPSEAFGAVVDQIMKGSLKQLAYLASRRMTDDDKRELMQQFMHISAQAARIGAYLDYRGGCGEDRGHEKAVRYQNKIARDIRRVQGYHTTPDINF